MIDRGFTLIGFPEHENVIGHASSKPEAIKNFVSLLDTLRHYGASKGERIYFSGDPATDDTVKEIDFYYVPSRFYHLTFAQKYQKQDSSARYWHRLLLQPVVCTRARRVGYRSTQCSRFLLRG